ncbi:MAG: hypothetical protein HQL42_19815 [Alphaproteobacteria bacterium]|nr:hypothetical protein [Alphaproteobacteria bacterium]
MIETFLGQVDSRLHSRSGAVFYSGRTAFTQPADVYILGLNPGGSPERRPHETLSRHMAKVLAEVPDLWSEYTDESWDGDIPGRHGMQPRLIHMLDTLNLDPRRVPASNVVFVRSTSEAALAAEKQELLRRCWPVHDMVIRNLGIKVIVCLGGTAGRWVREALEANEPVDRFVEANGRRWTSEAHANASGQYVLTLTHPGRADWRNPKADPTPLVQKILALKQPR